MRHKRLCRQGMLVGAMRRVHVRVTVVSEKGSSTKGRRDPVRVYREYVGWLQASAVGRLPFSRKEVNADPRITPIREELASTRAELVEAHDH